jgi:hypothetical protein
MYHMYMYILVYMYSICNSVVLQHKQSWVLLSTALQQHIPERCARSVPRSERGVNEEIFPAECSPQSIVACHIIPPLADCGGLGTFPAAEMAAQPSNQSFDAPRKTLPHLRVSQG